MGDAKRRLPAPTEFAALLAALGVPAPWEQTPGFDPGVIHAINGRHALTVDVDRDLPDETVDGIVEAVCLAVNDRAGVATPQVPQQQKATPCAS